MTLKTEKNNRTEYCIEEIGGRKLEEGRGDHHCKTPDYSLAWTTIIPIGQHSHVTKSSHSFSFSHFSHLMQKSPFSFHSLSITFTLVFFNFLPHNFPTLLLNPQ